MSVSRVPKFLRSRGALLALASAAVVLPAAPASAASVSLKITDPASDATGGAALDITGAVITQDTGTGNVTATMSFAAAPSSGASVAIGLGKLKDGTCSVGNDGDVSLLFLLILSDPPSGIWALGGDTSSRPVNPSISGSTLKVSSGSSSSLKKLGWNCANVAIQQQGENEGDALGDNATGSGVGSGGAQVVVLTDKPDGDKDGVPDVADACPTEPGASANGCLTIAAKLALRLGAKRVAVDLLVPKTGATCASTAKATVKDGSKSVGKGALEVGVHGAFCHISGVIKTKKHGKKVKVKIAGSGFKTISKAITR